MGRHQYMHAPCSSAAPHTTQHESAEMRTVDGQHVDPEPCDSHRIYTAPQHEILQRTMVAALTCVLCSDTSRLSPKSASLQVTMAATLSRCYR